MLRAKKFSVFVALVIGSVPLESLERVNQLAMTNLDSRVFSDLLMWITQMHCSRHFRYCHLDGDIFSPVFPRKLKFMSISKRSPP